MTQDNVMPGVGAMISANATACPRCGAVFSRTLVTVGLAIMLAIAVLYSLLQDIHEAGEGAVTGANSGWMRSACRPIGAGKTLCTRSPPLPLSKLRSRAPDARASRGPQQKCGRQS
jgi:hypothetical protein